MDDARKGHRERLKERFRQHGLSGFQEHEKLELLLMFAIPHKDVKPLAHLLIKAFGGLSGVLEASVQELERVPGVGGHTAVLLSMIPEFSRAYQMDKIGERAALMNRNHAGQYCAALFIGLNNEHVFLISLDARKRVIHASSIFEGTLDEAPFYPRMVVENLLRHHAQTVILAHNHPGGTLAPSRADITATREIKKTLEGMNVELYDHFIIAQGQFLSMANLPELREIFEE